MAAIVATLLQPQLATAHADPAPGYEFDAATLQQRMDQCTARIVDDNFILMGWVKVATCETRQWRCSSLKHMLEDERPGGEQHDPYSDVDGFMRCADRVVSYGFPRPGSGVGNIDNILQFRGIEQRAHVIHNELTGDIATIYTEPIQDNWRDCATWTPGMMTSARSDQANPWQIQQPLRQKR